MDHEILLKKLQNLGIKGNALAWIKSFLTGRTQKVAVDGHHSDPAPVLSGVPQGTVLGPVLFIVYINDMKDCILHAPLRSFADDTRLLQAIETIEDVKKLQKDLQNVIQWSIENNMQLHEDKFEFMQHVLSKDALLLKELPFVVYEQLYT